MAIAVLVMIIIAAANHQPGVRAKVETTKYQPLKQTSGILFGCSSLKPGVLLTIDDGPSRITDDILDLLQKHNVTAVFFLNEHNTNLHQEKARKIAHNGHELGIKINDEEGTVNNVQELREKIKSAEMAVINATGIYPRFLRMANVTQERLKVASSLGHTLVIWNGAAKRVEKVESFTPGIEGDDDDESDDDTTKKLKRMQNQFQFVVNNIPAQGGILKLSEDDRDAIRWLEFILNDGGLIQYKPIPLLTPKDCFSY